MPEFINYFLLSHNSRYVVGFAQNREGDIRCHFRRQNHTTKKNGRTRFVEIAEI